MDAFLRVANRVPWPVSAAFGWSGLLSMPLLAEVCDRESPESAASHCATVGALRLGSAAVNELRTHGFVVGLFTHTHTAMANLASEHPHAHQPA